MDDTDKGPFRVGIVGYGLAGRVFHGPLVAACPGLEVTAVVTSDDGRRARAVHDHPGAAVVPDVDSLFAGPLRPDVVVVATPNDSHVPIATRAVDAGVAVVVDKPLAASSSDAAQLVDRARRAGVLLTVFHNRRWDGDFLTVRRLVSEGRLGSVHRFESRFERWRPLRRDGWREDPDPARAGGVLYDLGSHLIDQALQLFGPATHVYAELDRRRPGTAVDDDAFVALTHTPGVRSHLWAGSLVAQRGPRFRVLGDRAGYQVHGLDVQEAQLADGLRPGAAGFGHAAPGQEGRLGADGVDEPVPTEAGSYLSFYTQLVEALAGAGPPPVEPDDAVAVVRVIEAALRSAADAVVVDMGSDAPGPASTSGVHGER